MDTGLSRVLPRGLKVGKSLRLGTGVGARRGLSGIGLGLTLYGLAAALLILRAPAILGDKWSWLALVLIPDLTILVGGLRTGTAWLSSSSTRSLRPLRWRFRDTA